MKQWNRNRKSHPTTYQPQGTTPQIMRGFLACALFLFHPYDSIVVHASSTGTPASKLEATLLGRHADPLVSVAPLVIGTTCQDGCVLLAVHTMFAQEPLLLDDTSSSEEDEGLQGLPREYRGPFRVFSVDSHGTSIACAGWRADGQTLVDYCKHLAKKEVAIYGTRSQVDVQYGNYLATEASLWLARSAVSGKVHHLAWFESDSKYCILIILLHTPDLLFN